MTNRSLTDTFKEFTLISIHDTLTAQNNVDRIPLVIDKKEGENYAIELCQNFEKKYNKKLNYKIEKDICYFFL